eukprot:1122726-Pyramimonas_sp.AAC.1
MAFPGFTWDPVEPNVAEWVFQPELPDMLTNKQWSYQQSLFPAIIWYFAQLRWATGDATKAPLS